MVEEKGGRDSAYREAGVDIDAGNRAVDLFKKHAASTWGKDVLAGIGGFAGLYAFDCRDYKSPVLVTGTDGVGTKLKIAQMMRRHETVGIDLVAMCVNDILVCGAKPLFFLDYFACGKLDPEQAAAVVSGVAAGCREAGCALIGGETAEMPGFYQEGEYDLAGFVVGVVDKEEIWDGRDVCAGDVVLGLASSGLHSNGYSLVRHLFLEKAGYQLETFFPDLGKTLGEELLTPTRIYVRSVLQAKKRFGKSKAIKAAAHITGGGLVENIPRVLPSGLGVVLRQGSWSVPPVFRLIQRTGVVSPEEMFRVFNMGIGFVLIVDPGDAEKIAGFLEDLGEKVYFIGKVEPGSGVKIE
ncbi:MAG: Phosphoribosylformylglycinamidine cyclo-ligase [Thermoanaerobacterales bacterium 50_218]|nr:MAG: Phosphoribosylformylglycinamidine cyclo-ligase [Thermoanaerobacterales bacterium 50_218]HAA90742.1 phosphoribosylformylglycinamidine cyclo-ligase [Peptococcaceae bacterium]